MDTSRRRYPEKWSQEEGYEDGLSEETMRRLLKNAYNYSDEKIDDLFAMAGNKNKENVTK